MQAITVGLGYHDARDAAAVVIAEVFRSVVIPVLGLVTASAGAARVDLVRLARGLARPWRAVALAAAITALVFGLLLTARYATWHSFVYDLGSYDQKIWLASVQPDFGAALVQTWRGGDPVSPCATPPRYWGICHFQPLYLVYAALYRVWASPLVLLWIQALLVASGIVPCYRLARLRLGDDTALVVALLYLLHPAVQVNGLLDFRPDHIAVPCLLWAYLFLEQRRIGPAVALAVLPALAKETLLLPLAGFGAYLAARRRPWLGLWLAGLSGAAFVIVMFHVLAAPDRSEGAVMIGRYLSVQGLLDPELAVRKLVYVTALFAPLGFLPLLAPATLLPAAPALAIALLSGDATHSSVQSQYSASTVAPMFAALVEVLPGLPARFGARAALAPMLAALLVLSVAASVVIGPTPLSLSFWSRSWGRHWHYTHYLPDRQASLNAAAALIPTDPGVMVVSQNDLNAAHLAHRRFFYAFPNGLDRADFVFLDTGRLPFVYWVAKEPARYAALVSGLRSSVDYRVAFEREGVLVFARTTPRDPGPPDPGRTPSPPRAMPR